MTMTYGNSISCPSKMVMDRDALDCTKNILPVLWDVIEKSKNIRHISINIVKIDNELVVTVMGKKKTLRFKNADNKKLIDSIKSYFN